MLDPTLTPKTFVAAIETTSYSFSRSVKLGEKFILSINTKSFESINPCSFTVVNVMIQVILLYAAVCIPKSDPLKATPTIVPIPPLPPAS